MNAYLMALAALIAMVALGAYMWPRRRLYQLSWQLPGPSGYPVIGSAYFFLDATSKFRWIVYNCWGGVNTCVRRSRTHLVLARVCELENDEMEMAISIQFLVNRA